MKKKIKEKQSQSLTQSNQRREENKKERCINRSFKYCEKL